MAINGREALSVFNPFWSLNMINRKAPLALTFALSLSFFGCASQYRAPESIDAKMARFAPKTQNLNTVPAMPTLPQQYQALVVSQTARGRAPASATTETEIGHTNKRLYFLTLFSQYHTLSQMSQTHQADLALICPHFHSQLVDHRQAMITQTHGGQTKFSATQIEPSLNDEGMLLLNPEFALPMTEKNAKPRVIDMLSQIEPDQRAQKAQDLVQKALSLHLDKTRGELQELCQTGSSDNYYIFENMVAHQKRQQLSVQSRSAEGLQTLLRSSVLFNHALTNSLQKKVVSTPSRAPASNEESVGQLTQEVLKRLGAEWSMNYFQAVGH